MTEAENNKTNEASQAVVQNGRHLGAFVAFWGIYKTTLQPLALFERHICVRFGGRFARAFVGRSHLHAWLRAVAGGALV